MSNTARRATHHGRLPYDLIKDFAPVSRVAFLPLALFKSPTVTTKTLPELVALIKSQPGKFNFSSSGKGGAPHLAGEMFKMSSGLDMVHVPYNGAGPALTDVAAGQVQLTFTTYTSAQALLAAAGIPIAAPSANRSGRPSPTTFADAVEETGPFAAAALDGGPCGVGLESTVVAILPGAPPRLLRPGAVTRAQIEAYLDSDEDVDTVLGLMAKLLNKVPIPGSTVQWEGIELVAERGNDRSHTITTVLASPAPEDGDPAAEAAAKLAQESAVRST